MKVKMARIFLPLVVVLLIANMLAISVAGQESAKSPTKPINKNILLDENPLDIWHINISKSLDESNRIVYQIVVENYTSPTEYKNNAQYQPGYKYQPRPAVTPDAVSVYYSVNDNVYINYNEIKTEFRPMPIGRDARLQEYRAYKADIYALCKDDFIKGGVSQLAGLVPIIGTFFGFLDLTIETTKCLPIYSWWCKCIIKYTKQGTDQSMYTNADVPVSEIATSIEGKTENERNRRRSNTILFNAVTDPEQFYVGAVRFTIPLRIKDPNNDRDIRLWINSIGAFGSKIGVYLEDPYIDKFKSQNLDLPRVNDKTGAAITGRITDVTWPTKETYDYTDPIPVEIGFTSTGSQERSFWIGYSVQDSTGKWWDAPAQQTATIQPGKSGSLELEWKPPEDAPEGAYTAKVAFWEGRNSDTGLMEGEFDSKTKDNAFHLNPIKATNVPQDLSSASMWISKGEELYEQGRYEETLQAFDKAIELDPTLIDAWCGKGMIFAILGKYDDALQAADKAIELNPGLAVAWALKGLVLNVQGKINEAEVAAAKAKELGYTGDILIPSIPKQINNENMPQKSNSELKISDLVGTWINDDPEALGVEGVAGLSRIEIQQIGTLFEITIWAKGKPTDSSLDTVKVSSDANPLKVTHTFSWFTSTNTLTILSNGSLRVDFNMQCTDGTDRVFKKEYYFHKI
jgi:hypothetical protein